MLEVARAAVRERVVGSALTVHTSHVLIVINLGEVIRLERSGKHLHEIHVEVNRRVRSQPAHFLSKQHGLAWLANGAFRNPLAVNTAQRNSLGFEIIIVAIQDETARRTIRIRIRAAVADGIDVTGTNEDLRFFVIIEK